MRGWGESATIFILIETEKQPNWIHKDYRLLSQRDEQANWIFIDRYELCKDGGE